MVTLRELFIKYNCDKAKKHQYDIIYEGYFSNVRNQSIRILELGVFRGASTKALLEYFPKAKLYGIDTFERYSKINVKNDINNEERSSLLRGDITDEEIVSKIKKTWGNIKFDFIIDDAAHYPESNRQAFLNFINLMKVKGTYFIEDWWPWDIMNAAQRRNRWLTERPDKYNDKAFERAMALFDTYTLKRHDNRMISKQPDSYILAIQK